MLRCRATSCSKARSDWLAAYSRTNAMSSVIVYLYMDAQPEREQIIFNSSHATVAKDKGGSKTLRPSHPSREAADKVRSGVSAERRNRPGVFQMAAFSRKPLRRAKLFLLFDDEHFDWPIGCNHFQAKLLANRLLQRSHIWDCWKGFVSWISPTQINLAIRRRISFGENWCFQITLQRKPHIRHSALVTAVFHYLLNKLG